MQSEHSLPAFIPLGGGTRTPTPAKTHFFLTQTSLSRIIDVAGFQKRPPWGSSSPWDGQISQCSAKHSELCLRNMPLPRRLTHFERSENHCHWNLCTEQVLMHQTPPLALYHAPERRPREGQPLEVTLPAEHLTAWWLGSQGLSWHRT